MSNDVELMVSKRSIDYYGVLGLNKSATLTDIRREYRRLALEYNPERQNDKSLYSLFVLVGEAYEVLSSPLLKALYDQYGEEGLKKGIVTPYGWNPPYAYHGDPLKTYKDFFGTTSPYADLLDAVTDPPPLFSFGDSKGVKKKEPPFIKPLALSLEEIFHGGLKIVKIQRRAFVTEDCDATELQEKLLNVNITPGIPVGTQITFPECGDMGPSIIPGDIVFVIEDKPHPVFRREGVNIYMKAKITIEEALIGTTVTVNTIDKRTLRVAITQVVTPDYIKIVEGEGMPHPVDRSLMGDLMISFDVEYPSYIPQPSKKLISRAFALSATSQRPKSPDLVNNMVNPESYARPQLL
ncbi:dnaJ homolog subfamily B member 13-like [Cimex lectularius]|uniref:J domain-containing protein n=1 Tax=Cimex lectularius TaxID=79782 RepID=A0A8I6S4P0_CIMLE|nr:dnaJ homolog subfamily B member 13-like [Cimex lectularius]